MGKKMAPKWQNKKFKKEPKSYLFAIFGPFFSPFWAVGRSLFFGPMFFFSHFRLSGPFSDSMPGGLTQRSSGGVGLTRNGGHFSHHWAVDQAPCNASVGAHSEVLGMVCRGREAAEPSGFEEETCIQSSRTLSSSSTSPHTSLAKTMERVWTWKLRQPPTPHISKKHVTNICHVIWRKNPLLSAK